MKLKYIIPIVTVPLILFFIIFLQYTFVYENTLAAKLKKPIVIDYWPVEFNDFEKLNRSPDFVKVINLSFAVPNGTGELEWKDIGGNRVDPQKVKEIIEFFKKQNKLVLVAIGGADALDWNLERINLESFASYVKHFIDEYHLDGIDIDYELSTQRDKLTPFIKALRQALPSDKYLITYAAFSIGAYGTEDHKHEEWTDAPMRGIDVPTLSETKNDIDWVNVMTYNAFVAEMEHQYNPIESLLAFKKLVGSKDKVVLGILLGQQDFPEGVIINSQNVKPWIEFIKKENYKGIMFYQLSKDVEEVTKEPDGTFNEVTKTILFP